MVRVIKNTLLLTILLLQSSCYLFSFQKLDKITVSQLKQKYAISLTDGWTAEKADSLLGTFESIYQESEDQNHSMNPSVWKISDEDLEDDAQIEFAKDLKHVTISRDVFFS